MKEAIIRMYNIYFDMKNGFSISRKSEVNIFLWKPEV